MFVDKLKTEKFAVAFSFLIGFAIIVLAIPQCTDDKCIFKKAPSFEDMKKNTYKFGSKCYQFRSETKACPATGVIEAFKVMKRK